MLENHASPPTPILSPPSSHPHPLTPLLSQVNKEKVAELLNILSTLYKGEEYDDVTRQWNELREVCFFGWVVVFFWGWMMVRFFVGWWCVCGWCERLYVMVYGDIHKSRKCVHKHMLLPWHSITLYTHTMHPLHTPYTLHTTYTPPHLHPTHQQVILEDALKKYMLPNLSKELHVRLLSDARGAMIRKTQNKLWRLATEVVVEVVGWCVVCGVCVLWCVVWCVVWCVCTCMHTEIHIIHISYSSNNIRADAI